MGICTALYAERSSRNNAERTVTGKKTHILPDAAIIIGRDGSCMPSP